MSPWKALVFILSSVFLGPLWVTSGLALEYPISSILQDSSITGQRDDPPNEWRETQRQAEDYLMIRAGIMRPERRSEWLQSCRGLSKTFFSADPFCILSEESIKTTALYTQRQAKKRALRNEARAATRSWIQGLIKKKYDLMEEVSDTHLPIAASFLSQDRNLAKGKTLEMAVQQMLAIRSCPPVSILVSLGLVSEKYFPDERYRQLALSLYERAELCGQGLVSKFAGFRAGLLHIWKEDWNAALVSFEKLMKHETPEYRMRALYWRYYAAEQLKNKKLSDEMLSNLKRDFPLSLYSVVVGGGQLPNEPAGGLQARCRSIRHLEINRGVRAIEVLLALGEKASAVQLLRKFSDHWLDKVGGRSEGGSDIPFLFYCFALFLRAEDRVGAFQFLAGMFRNNPQLISKSTMELMYPLLYWEEVTDKNAQIDPFLPLAVIRQESAFKESVISPMGAMGLMQLRWQTARSIEKISRNNLRIAKDNIRIGIRYLRRLVKQYQGDLEVALAAYNAGPTRVRDWARRYPRHPSLLFLDFIPVQESREYVSSVTRNYWWYRVLYSSREPKLPLGEAQPGSLIKEKRETRKTKSYFSTLGDKVEVSH